MLDQNEFILQNLTPSSLLYDYDHGHVYMAIIDYKILLVIYDWLCENNFMSTLLSTFPLRHCCIMVFKETYGHTIQ